MSINFEAANMAGYNNPEMLVFPVTVQVDGGLSVVGAPSYSAITNVIKSGYIPAIFANLPTGDRALLPLSVITNEGQYIFSASMHTAYSRDARQLISMVFGENLDAPHFLFSEI